MRPPFLAGLIWPNVKRSSRSNIRWGWWDPRHSLNEEDPSLSPTGPLSAVCNVQTMPMSMPNKIQNPKSRLAEGQQIGKKLIRIQTCQGAAKVGSPAFSLFYCFRLDFYYNDYNYIHRSINQGGWSADIYTSYLSICLWFMHMLPTPIFCLVTVHVLCFMARCDGCTALSTLGVNFFLYFLFSCFNSMSF